MKLSWSAIKSALRFSAWGGQGRWQSGLGDWRNWWGSAATGGVNYGALVGDIRSNPVVECAISYLQRAFPEADFQVVRKESSTGEEKPDLEHPLTALWNHPNPFYSSDTMTQAIVADRACYGNAYLYKERNGAGDVIALWHVPANRIIPQWPPDGKTFISQYMLIVDAREEPIPTRDIVHFRFGKDPQNERLGISPWASCLREIAELNEGSNYRNTLLRKMGVPSHVGNPKDPTKPINADQARQLHALWDQRVSGNERGSLIIPNMPMQFDKIGMSPAELDLGTMQNTATDMVCSAVGLNSMALNLSSGSEHRTFANYGESREACIEGALVPAWKQMAEELTLQLLPDFSTDPAERVEFCLDNVRALQEDEDKLWGRVIDAYKAEIIDRYTSLTLLGRKAETKDKDVYYQQAGGVSGEAPLGLDGKPTQPTALGGVPAPNGNGTLAPQENGAVR